LLLGFFHSWHRKILFPSGLKQLSKTKHENSPKPAKGQDKNPPGGFGFIAVIGPEFTEDIKAIGWQPQAKPGDGYFPHAIPKAYGFEAATQGGTLLLNIRIRFCR
jgi:hypothetical protein